jgi:hypothetical protein
MKPNLRFLRLPCSSSGSRPEYRVAAQELGAELVRRDWHGNRLPICCEHWRSCVRCGLKSGSLGRCCESRGQAERSVSLRLREEAQSVLRRGRGRTEHGSPSIDNTPCSTHRLTALKCLFLGAIPISVWLAAERFQSATSHFFAAPALAPVRTPVLHAFSGTWQSPLAC